MSKALAIERLTEFARNYGFTVVPGETINKIDDVFDRVMQVRWDESSGRLEWAWFNSADGINSAAISFRPGEGKVISYGPNL